METHKESIRRLISRLRRDDGQALVEYALVLGLVCVAAVALLDAMGASITSLLQSITSALASAV